MLYNPAPEGSRHQRWMRIVAAARAGGFGLQSLQTYGEYFCSLNPGFPVTEMRAACRWAVRNVAPKGGVRA
jgi:hypothetical protein